MENIKPNDVVWFMSGDRVLYGYVTEVFKNIVHVHVKRDDMKPAEFSEYDEYALRKDYLAHSRRELMLAFDEGVEEIKKQYEKLRNMRND